MSRKSAQKKRHTKPCRYFQINKCPHSADVCDFAHVIATSVVPLQRESGVCRYYAAGRCNNGQGCRYQHGPILGTGIDYWPQSQADSDANNFFCSRYPAAYGHVRPTSSFNSCVTCPHVSESILFAPLLHPPPPPRSRDSIDTASNSISSLDSDDLVVVTNDPQYSEHSHSHQSRVYVEDVSPLVHVPPFCSGANMNVVSPTGVYDYGLSNLVAGAMQAPKPKPQQHTKPMSKQKLLKYKTKPCKFFTSDKGCPNGSTCTFIHDEIRDYSDPSSPRPMTPVKYPSLADETDKKSFFPITWRVIGGGVRVGVVKENQRDMILNDNGNAFEHSTPHKPSQLPPLQLPSRKRSNSIPSTPSNTLFNVEQLFSAESPGVL